MITQRILCLAVLCIVAGCRDRDSELRDPEVEKISTGFQKYKLVAKQVKDCKNVALYEGLPHQSWEPEKLKSELATKKTVELGNFPFYAEKLVVNEKDAAQLKALYCNSSSFRPFGGFKNCGGYHPDYCIEWRNGTDVFLVHICLGCHEMKTFWQGNELYCDIDHRAFKEFEKILKAYRKNRPERESGQ